MGRHGAGSGDKARRKGLSKSDSYEFDRENWARLVTDLLVHSQNDTAALTKVIETLDNRNPVVPGRLSNKWVGKKLRHLLRALKLVNERGTDGEAMYTKPVSCKASFLRILNKTIKATEAMVREKLEAKDRAHADAVCVLEDAHMLPRAAARERHEAFQEELDNWGRPAAEQAARQRQQQGSQSDAPWRPFDRDRDLFVQKPLSRDSCKEYIVHLEAAQTRFAREI